jgi:hypothetical protein
MFKEVPFEWPGFRPVREVRWEWYKVGVRGSSKEVEVPKVDRRGG